MRPRQLRGRLQDRESDTGYDTLRRAFNGALALIGSARVGDITSTDSAVFLRGARAFTLQHPPVQQVEDVTRIEDLPDLSDADLGRMRAIRDEARQKNGVTRQVRLATAVRGVSERPELAPSDRFRYGERVASQQVDVLVAER